MCYAQTQNTDFTKPLVTFISGRRSEGPTQLSPFDPPGFQGPLATMTGSAKYYQTNRYSEEAGGYLPGATNDALDPGKAPDGFYSSYRFGPDGQVQGSLDGKTFAAIEGLCVVMDAIRKAYQPLAWVSL